MSAGGGGHVCVRRSGRRWARLPDCPGGTSEVGGTLVGQLGPPLFPAERDAGEVCRGHLSRGTSDVP